MAADFNPYHVWLGIPPDEQPANHYQLLGIRLFEIEADVIDSAADRQMAHLRSFQSGKHGELSQQLLNEVAAARVCLLDPQKRAAYHQKLQATLPAEIAVVASEAVPAAVTATSNRARTRVVADEPQPADQWADLLGDSAAKPTYRSARKSSIANARKGSAAKRAAKNRNMSIGITVAVLLIAAAGVGWLALNGSSSEGTLQTTGSGSEPIVAKAAVVADRREKVSIAPPEVSLSDMPHGGELSKTDCVGEEAGNPYEDVSSPNGLVVGFNCTVVPGPGKKRSPIVKSIQPVYLKGGQRAASNAHGHPEGDTIMVEAKQGYAVAGVVVRAGSRIDGFKVIFMRIGKSALDATSSYESDWIGGRGGASEKTLGGDGRPVIGIYGFSGRSLHRVGLIQTK